LNNLNNNPGDIDEMRLKRGIIIRIRQYINKYPLVLKIIYGSKKHEFEKKLYNLSVEKLNIILENIRVEMTLHKNSSIFMNIVETGLRSYEKISSYSGYNIDGLTDSLLLDKEFLDDMDQIACETDLSQWINPKSSAFFKVMRTTYQKYKENEVKDKIDNIVNDKDKLDKIKKLDKKIS